MSTTIRQRKTLQRTAIRAAIEAADRPLSPQEILGAAQSEAPGIGIATIYRNIKNLVEEGWLHTVDLPGAASRYEVAGKDHHHHFHCRGCDKVFEVEHCPGRVGELAPRGFQPETHDIILYGLCPACAV
jgi:Fur family transcriptional regulator, ferric uptake regulator